MRAQTEAARRLGAERIERQRVADRVVVRLLILFQVPDVGPVRVEDVAAQFCAVAQHERKEILREVVDPAALHAVEDAGLEDVDAGIDGVGEDLSPRRLLEETDDAAVIVGDDDAELERIGHALQRDGDVVAGFAMMAHQRREIDVGQRVAADDEERRAGQEVVRHLDRARGAERRVLDDVVHLHAERAAVPEPRLDLVGEIVEGSDDLGEAVPPQQIDDVLHDRLAGDGRERFRAPRCQRTQS